MKKSRVNCRLLEYRRRSKRLGDDVRRSREERRDSLIFHTRMHPLSGMLVQPALARQKLALVLAECAFPDASALVLHTGERADVPIITGMFSRAPGHATRRGCKV